jgi:hypothetical protein
LHVQKPWLYRLVGLTVVVGALWLWQNSITQAFPTIQAISAERRESLLAWQMGDRSKLLYPNLETANQILLQAEALHIYPASHVTP